MLCRFIISASSEAVVCFTFLSYILHYTIYHYIPDFIGLIILCVGFSYHVFPMCFCIFSFSFCNFLLFAYVFLEVRTRLPRNRFGASIPGFAGKYIHILIHIPISRPLFAWTYQQGRTKFGACPECLKIH